MSWQGVLDAVDAAEAWIVGQSFWVQIALLLAVLLPLCWLLAGLIDRVVERFLRRHTDREARRAGPVDEPEVLLTGAHGEPTPSERGSR